MIFKKIFKNHIKKLLTNEQQNSYQNSKICYICKVKFEDKHATENIYCKVRYYCHYRGEQRGTAHVICNIKYSVPEITTIVSRNGYSYDYHSIIKELPEEFEKQFNCLGENTKK